MKTAILMFLFLMIPQVANAQFPSDHPDSHTEYDWKSGNQYQIEHHNNIFEQDTHVRGSNFNTGSTWDTTIDNDGDMRGHDADGNSWNYDKGSSLYQNYGTGKTCVGEGAARTCF